LAHYIKKINRKITKFFKSNKAQTEKRNYSCCFLYGTKAFCIEKINEKKSFTGNNNKHAREKDQAQTKGGPTTQK
jgi:hypothetical protein